MTYKICNEANTSKKSKCESEIILLEGQKVDSEGTRNGDLGSPESTVY